jgi:biopolymer transport protein ExbD
MTKVERSGSQNGKAQDNIFFNTILTNKKFMKSDFNYQSDDNDNHEQVISEINITPLVDVMLLLMVIFLVTAPLMVNNLNIKLPKAVGAAETKSISKTISVKENGEIYFEDKAMSAEQLNTELAKLSSNKDIIIKIAAHHNSPYQYVATILSTLNQNKISNISFLTEN